jgi:cyclin-dependent kinase 2
MLGSNEYSTPIDIWSVGCIFAELYNKTPLFCGDSEIDQLHKIFMYFSNKIRTMGTPDSNSWNGVTELPNFNPEFPKWSANNLKKYVPLMDSVAFDLLSKMIVLDPIKRISAKDALEHVNFNLI